MAKKKTRTSASKKPTKKKAAPKKPAKKKAVAKKAAPKKPAKKKAAAKTPAKKKAAAKPPAKKKVVAATRKPIKRRDATGHLDPSYEHDLARGRQKPDDDRAFLVGERADEPLAQELGREFVETVTSGEDEGTELRDEFVAEEIGGPFVTTTRGQEVDEKPDASNPADATREPFPKTSGGD
jgi:hypothetical protein